MTRSEASNAPLLTPSEWLVFRAVREASSPVTPGEIAGRWPTLSPEAVSALVDRLAQRQLVHPQGQGWVASPHDPSLLLGRLFEHWLVSHALERPEDLETVLRLLEVRIEGQSRLPGREVG